MFKHVWDFYEVPRDAATKLESSTLKRKIKFCSFWFVAVSGMAGVSFLLCLLLDSNPMYVTAAF